MLSRIDKTFCIPIRLIDPTRLGSHAVAGQCYAEIKVVNRIVDMGPLRSAIAEARDNNSGLFVFLDSAEVPRFTDAAFTDGWIVTVPTAPLEPPSTGCITVISSGLKYPCVLFPLRIDSVCVHTNY